VRPLVSAGIIPAGWPVTVNAVSGYSGGGKAMIAEFEAGGAEAFRAYGLSLKHKHVPEMTLHTGLERPVLFAPAVGAYRQGMLVEVPLQLAALPSSPSVEVVHGALAEAYADCRFVEVVELETTEAMTGIDPEGLNGDQPDAPACVRGPGGGSGAAGRPAGQPRQGGRRARRCRT
jgi:N-acetyl-gamma-glutamyl-phosphate reductase